MLGELFQCHAESMTDLRGDGKGGVGFATLDLAEVFATDATFTSKTYLLSPQRSRSSCKRLGNRSRMRSAWS
jgi:hypothetical protein